MKANKTDKRNAKITPFGKAIRKARIDTDETMPSMAEELGVSVSFISQAETGNKKITPELVQKISAFFAKRGKVVADLAELADVSNDKINIAHLPFEQQLLMARLNKVQLTAQQVQELSKMIAQEDIKQDD